MTKFSWLILLGVYTVICVSCSCMLATVGIQWPALSPGSWVAAGDLILFRAKRDVSPAVTCRFKV